MHSPTGTFDAADRQRVAGVLTSMGLDCEGGNWNTGFDHAGALKKIHCAVLLIQANTGNLPDGTLDGAMSKQDAERAMTLLKDGRYRKVDSDHVVNLDKPDIFLNAITDAFSRQ